MAVLARQDFSAGWMPDADATNAPPNALLRGDNLILDELGILAVRQGSTKINSVALGDIDVHSLYTAVISGTRYRFSGAAANVYSNGVTLGVTMASSGDVIFGSYMGQVFFARSTSKHKYDGSTVRTWGVGMTSGVPTHGSGAADALWKIVYVRNDGTYLAKSAPSAASAAGTWTTGMTVTAPADGSRDSQINEIWLFRADDLTEGAYYRVAVKTGVSGTGSVAITDSTSSADALVINIKLESDNAVPPDSIVDIEGPYYDRLFVLTATTLYPSRRLNPDSYSADQAIVIAGADETCLWVKKSLGGLYIGTTKDIYRLDGTGAEFEDGTMDFTLTPTNIDSPPRAAGTATREGNLLVYLAADGWRTMQGVGSSLLTGRTSLLYKAKARHGVSAVNLTGGRFRAAISRGQLAALIPEGASTTTTAVQYRYQFDKARWYRFTYGSQAWRAIHREPDGTLIASDAAGFVWILDTGTQDDSVDIPVVMWTKVDDDDKPLQRKDPWDLRAKVDTNGATATAEVYFDGSSTAAGSISIIQTGMGVTLGDISSLAAAFRQVQLRITGSFSTFKWFDHGIGYREHPAIQVYAETKPDQPSPSRRRFGGIRLIIDTLGEAATVTPMVDGLAMSSQEITTTTAQGITVSFPARINRDAWIKISKATGFELYSAEPLVLEEFPPIMQGITVPNDAGYPGIKTMSGVQLRICTLGASVTVDTIIDRVITDSFTVQTGVDESVETTLRFPKAYGRAGTIVQLRFSADVEVYNWSPLVTAKRPLGIKAWNSGPLDLGGGEFIWPREVWLKVEAGADLVVIPYFDGVTFDTVTATIGAGELNTASKIRIPVPRGYKGKVPKFEIRSAQPFYPFWIEFVVRQTRGEEEKEPIRVEAQVGGEVVA